MNTYKCVGPHIKFDGVFIKSKNRTFQTRRNYRAISMRALNDITQKCSNKSKLTNNTLYYVRSRCRTLGNATSREAQRMMFDLQITYTCYPPKLPATIEFGWGWACSCLSPPLSPQISSHAQPTRICLCGTCFTRASNCSINVFVANCLFRTCSPGQERVLQVCGSSFSIRLSADKQVHTTNASTITRIHAQKHVRYRFTSEKTRADLVWQQSYDGLSLGPGCFEDRKHIVLSDSGPRHNTYGVCRSVNMQ